MIIELLIRFIIGGLVVSAFALIGMIIRPRTFAGLFSAAPSVALATLGLTFMSKGPSVAAIEGRSMMLGAIAFIVYAALIGWLLIRRTPHTLTLTVVSLAAWFAIALALYGAVLA